MIAAWGASSTVQDLFLSWVGHDREHMAVIRSEVGWLGCPPELLDPDLEL